MLNIAYGLKVKSDTDKFIGLAEHAVQPVNQASVPGAYLVVCNSLILYFPGYIFHARFIEPISYS